MKEKNWKYYNDKQNKYLLAEYGALAAGFIAQLAKKPAYAAGLYGAGIVFCGLSVYNGLNAMEELNKEREKLNAFRNTIDILIEANSEKTA